MVIMKKYCKHVRELLSYVLKYISCLDSHVVSDKLLEYNFCKNQSKFHKVVK